MPEVHIAISATFTAEPLCEPLAFLFDLLGWKCSISFAPFSQVFQSALDEDGPFAKNRDGVNIVLARPGDLRPDPAGVKELAEALLVAGRRGTHPLLVRVCPPSAAGFEQALIAALGKDPAVVVLPDEEQHGLYPVEVFEDPKGEELGAVPYTEEYFAALGALLSREVHRMLAGPCKLIVLDCDDTLWRGICGEDGPAGISIDAPHRALQEFMAAQQAAGRLLALASKNNEEDVLETFRAHPEMPLQLDHFVARRIHWESKYSSLTSIADELGLGLDSFVFIDDNPKECAEVAAELPAVVSLPLPERTEDFSQFLEHVWALDLKRAVTREDRTRRDSYAEQAERALAERRALTLDEFLASLRLEVETSPLAENQVARVAQLTQRTNQMNFTSHRRTENEVRKLLGAEKCFVTSVRDRFGDYGLVGVMILHDSTGELTIETFLLSCRALGRGVEHQMLRRAGEVAIERGHQQVVAPFESTGRNAPARDFLISVSNGARPPFRFAAAALANLTYRPSKNTLHRTPVSTTAREGASMPDYHKIAELAKPGDLLMAVRKARMHPRRRSSTNVPPQTEIERKLAALWSELLGVDSIGVHDNFFDMGGHSLLAVQLASRLHRDLGVDLPLEAVYTGTLTIAELAKSIEILQLGHLDGEQYAALLSEIEAMSEEEAEALLQRELGHS